MLTAAISKLSARSLVLDGEVAIYDRQLRSRFDWLREPDLAAITTPPILMAFDLLCCATAANQTSRGISRPAKLATMVVSSAGSTGFGTCMLKPAVSVRIRSSIRP